MIKITKIKNEKMSYLELQDRNLSIESKVPAYLFLRHDAFKCSLINSNGKTHTVKLSGEITKLNTKQLLSILIKVYNRKFINSFDDVEKDDSNNIFDFLYTRLAKGYNNYQSGWTILFHKEAENILERIFQSGYKGLIKDHIESLMELYSKKSNEKYSAEVRKNVYWEVYKLLNTRTDIGIQFTLNSKEFSGIVKLLLLDFVYESICNPDSNFDSNLIRVSHKNTEKMESMINVLNAIGKFEIDYSKYNEVSRAFEQSFCRFGLPLYLANNIMEEKYIKNHISNNIGFNYIDTIWERRYAVINKIREFITFHNGVECFSYGESMVATQQGGAVPSAMIQGCPAPAISASPMDVNYTYNPEVNKLQVTGLSIDYGNMSTILFRDLMMKFTEIKERWGAIKNSNPSEDTRQTMIYDLKSLYNQIQDARFRLRKSDTDTIDMESVETSLFSLMDDISNFNSSKDIALAESFGYGEELKTPEFVKKAVKAPINGLKKVGKKIKDKVKDKTDSVHFSLHEKKESFKDNIKDAGQGIANTTFRALRSIPILADVADTYDSIKTSNHMRKERFKKWKEERQSKKDGYKESFSIGEIARMSGYTSDNLFKYTKLNTYGEKLNGTVKEKVSYLLLGELYNGIESAKKEYNLYSFFPMGEFKNCINEIDSISIISENKSLIGMVDKLKNSIKELEFSPKSIGEKKEFFKDFENYSEFNKRQIILSAFESLNDTLAKLDGEGQKSILTAMGERFNGYLSNKQKEIISNRLIKADELLKKE